MRRHLARSSRCGVAAVLIAIGLPAACAPRQGPAGAAPAPAATAARPSALIVDPERPAHFKYAAGGSHYLCAAGDPEGFLYRGTRNADGTRAGDQQALIQKIAPTGANGIYVMAVRSHGGDGAADENPFVDSDPTRGLDEDILKQWDTWFSAMDAAGVVIYFFFYDDSARVWRTGDQVGPEERAFFETLVRRYRHHRHLVWVIGEEYSEGLNRPRVSALATLIAAADDRDHPIGVHQLNGLDFDFADDPEIDQFTIQYNVATARELHHGMVQAFGKAAGRYNLNMSEAAGHGTGAMARHKNWAAALGGASVMVIGMDIASTPVADLEDCGRLRRFMESTRFAEMAPHDELAFGASEYVLANPGQLYIAYASARSGDLGVRALAAGDWSMAFFDPVSGKMSRSIARLPAGDRTLPTPAGFGAELAVYLERQASPGETPQALHGSSRIAPGPVPGAAWTMAEPAAAGLDRAALETFAQGIGGRGVVVRHGRLVFRWGDASRRGDIASAAKPLYGFFLFKAVASGRLGSIDVPAVTYAPGLATLNPALAFKDRRITFRHFATQTSNYGVREAPGAAFDYNDWQMALFWDTLFLGVWHSSLADVDREVLDRELCRAIQCEDAPTFLAFGPTDRAGRLAISPRDLARFALLYLRGGEWNGTTVLPAAMVRESLHSPLPNSVPQTAGVAAPMLPGQRTIGSTRVPDNQTDHFGSYSFMWWVNGIDRTGRRLLPDAPSDTFMASGHGARRAAVVIPSLDLIATWNDTTIDGWPAANGALKDLLASVK